MARAPGAKLMEESLEASHSAKQECICWLRKLQELVTHASTRLQKHQAAYKRRFDQKIGSGRPICVNDYVFVRKEQAAKKEKLHKLSRKTLGPFIVIKVHDDNTVVISDGLRLERVNLDRCE